LTRLGAERVALAQHRASLKLLTPAAALVTARNAAACFAVTAMLLSLVHGL
jgi:hypothetical protein